MTLNYTAQVVSTEDLTEVAAGDSQLNITVDVGVVGTCKQQRNLGCRLTAQSHNDVAVDVGILTGAYHLAEVQRT